MHGIDSTWSNADKNDRLRIRDRNAGPQGTYVGLDQVNVLLPKSLRGAGNVTVQLTVDGQAANVVSLNFK